MPQIYLVSAYFKIEGKRLTYSKRASFPFNQIKQFTQLHTLFMVYVAPFTVFYFLSEILNPPPLCWWSAERIFKKFSKSLSTMVGKWRKFWFLGHLKTPVPSFWEYILIGRKRINIQWLMPFRTIRVRQLVLQGGRTCLPLGNFKKMIESFSICSKLTCFSWQIHRFLALLSTTYSNP